MNADPGTPFAALEPEGLDAFLLWASERGASDVSIQTGSPAMVEVDGRLERATARSLDGPAVQRIVGRLFRPAAADRVDEGGWGHLQAGSAIDCSHAVAVPGRRRAHRRFRVNISPVQVADRLGANVTLRVLPDRVPTLDDLGIEPEVAAGLELCRGLTLVTGVPGSGKSTVLAAATRRLLETGAGRIQTYEAPIEYVMDGLAGDGAMISQSEIPRHFPSFAEGLRSSLRRRPAAVVLGEARDRETVEATVRAADTGIAVYSTTHTIGVANTVRRLVAEFPAHERAERSAALADVLTMVVSQALLPDPSGGRTALREWLVFDRDLRERLSDAPHPEWPAILAARLADAGTTFAAAAARAEGRITERDRRRFAPEGIGR